MKMRADTIYKRGWLFPGAHPLVDETGKVFEKITLSQSETGA